MRLFNTRNASQSVEFSEAIVSPMARGGGLFAPVELPVLGGAFWEAAKMQSYAEFALSLIAKFEFDISDEDFAEALRAYEEFDEGLAVQITKFDEGVFVNELYHGKTRAFKDMALAPFGRLLSSFAAKSGRKFLAICATSGDTGPATLSAFSGAENVKVFCIYPDAATSVVQRLQMTTAKGENLGVVGIKGNFDDAQKTLKTLLLNELFKAKLSQKGYELSAANSVNFGRILFQIIYHAWAAFKLAKAGEKIDLIVPSGNFGDALGAFYAKLLGAPIGKIAIASNQNNVLTQLFNHGTYDIRGKKLQHTLSPAMDILVSSNVERLLFAKFGDVRTEELMKSLNENGFYQLSREELASLREDFVAEFCSDEETIAAIKSAASKGILLDPHTATCLKMLTPRCVITSTAQWVKFTPSMLKAVKNAQSRDELAELKELSEEFNSPVPSAILELFSAPILHPKVALPSEVESEILAKL